MATRCVEGASHEYKAVGSVIGYCEALRLPVGRCARSRTGVIQYFNRIASVDIQQVGVDVISVPTALRPPVKGHGVTDFHLQRFFADQCRTANCVVSGLSGNTRAGQADRLRALTVLSAGWCDFHATRVIRGILIRAC